MYDLNHSKYLTGWCKRIIKPWRRGGVTEYEKGWNDCLKEMEANYKKYVVKTLKELEETRKKEENAKTRSKRTK